MDELPLHIEDLVRIVENGPSDKGIQRLSHSMLLARHLGALADELVGYFVDQARDEGATWAEIGESMGVTKQAAQKRFVGSGSAQGRGRSDGIFARFTEEARHAVVGAEDHARQAGNDSVGTEHVVLALLDDPDGILADLIAQSEHDLHEVREAAAGSLTPGQGAVEGHVPFAPDAKKALDLALREAIRLGHGYIGTEHLVLGLLRDKKSNGAMLLVSAGITQAGAERWLEESHQ
jgi:hypothetical protein